MNRSSLSRRLCAMAAVLGVIVWSGCEKGSMTAPPPNSAPVRMAISFSRAGMPGLLKTSGLQSVDSLRIDSAVVVLSRIKFESHIDSVVVDSVGGGEDDLDRDQSIVFRGPFVIHIHDTVAINFADQVLPAGTYDGVRFKIHRLQDGEPHEDSDDRDNQAQVNDSSVIGSSIVVWGAIRKNSVWTAFTFHFDGEIEFKIKGTFEVASSTSTVRIALNFNMGRWFMDPSTGALLDPTNTSQENIELIRRAILTSFGKGRGGHDRGDGHPEDDRHDGGHQDDGHHDGD